MLNKSGGKVRLTFKLEQDQVWVGTKERTQKIPLNSIKVNIVRWIERKLQYIDLLDVDNSVYSVNDFKIDLLYCRRL
jgi:hypothetical protein